MTATYPMHIPILVDICTQRIQPIRHKIHGAAWASAGSRDFLRFDPPARTNFSFSTSARSPNPLSPDARSPPRCSRPRPQILSRPTLVPHLDALALDPKSSLAASPALEQLAADAACPCGPCASASAPTRAPLPQIGPKSTLGLGPCASASLPPGLPSPARCRAIEMTKDRAEAHFESSSTATAPSGGLPLVPCPNCHAQMIWAVSGSSKNQGKEYFKCPRNDGMYSGRCDTFMWKDQYMSHLSRLRLVEQQRRDHSPVKLSNGNEVVFTVDHRVLDHLDAMKTSLDQMKTSLDQMNNSVRKSTDGDEKLKIVLVAFLFLLLGICIEKIVN